eukprot:691686-Pyramimonas_sp.AAC.1
MVRLASGRRRFSLYSAPRPSSLPRPHPSSPVASQRNRTLQTLILWTTLSSGKLHAESAGLQKTNVAGTRIEDSSPGSR